MDYININGNEYLILDEIIINNIRYLYLSLETSLLNIMVNKVINENGKEYLSGLDTDDEVINALDIYFQRHKEEIGL